MAAATETRVGSTIGTGAKRPFEPVAGVASAAPAGPFAAMSIFERAFVTVIADAMARLKAGDSQNQAYAFMDARVRTLLSSWNTCRAIEGQLDRYQGQWTQERLAGLEQRLVADVARIRDRWVRRQYRRFFKRQLDELREAAA